MRSTEMPSQIHGNTLPPAFVQEVDQFFLHVFDRVFRIGGERASHAAALFLLLRKEGVLEVFAKEGRQATHIRQVILALHEAKKSDEINEVFYVLADTVDSLGVDQLGELLHAFTMMPETFLGEYYPEVVERLLFLLARAEGKYGGGFDQPIELTQFMLAIADMPPGGSVYNPFAGLASIGALLRKDAVYYGQELNQRTWALGMLRLLAHRPNAVNAYYRENSLTEWNYRSQRYDLVVANPPFNMRVDDLQFELGGKATSAESLFLYRALKDTKPGGKVMCVVPLGFLTSMRKDQRMIRERLVEDGCLDSVVEFPGGLLRFTSIPFALLVIDKARDPNAPVRMLDASSLVTSVSRSEKRIQVEALLGALEGRPQAGVLELVGQEAFRKSDHNLRPGRYMHRDELLVHGGVRLGRHAVPLKLDRFEPGAQAPFIRIRDLQETPLQPTLQLDKAEVCEVPRHAKRLDRSALLLAMRWSNLKPTWFEYSGTPIAVSNDILVMDADQSEVDIAYLVHELMSPKVQAQVEQLNRGLTIPSLRRQDILNILIELPSKLEQQAKVKGLREAFVKNQFEQAKRSAYQHEVRLANFANDASLEHRLGRPLLNLGSGASLLKRGLDELLPEWGRMVVGGKDQGITLGEVMKGMLFELQRVSDLLATDDADIDPAKYTLAPLDLADYAKRTARRIEVQLNGGHTVTFGVDPDIKVQLKGKARINGNADLLDIAVDAIVDNAVRHAFKGEAPPHYLEFWVGFKFVDDRPWLELSIGNSGTPFPAGFNRSRYVTKHAYAGTTGHTGVGGYHVDRVMEIQGGRVDIDVEPLLSGGRYSTAVTLSFPLHNTSA